MLEFKKTNSRVIMNPLSIKLSKETKFVSYFNFKQMEILKFKASFNCNQWPLDWLRTQIDTIKEMTSTMIWEMCRVKGGGICVVILTIIFLL
jgi:hypothetical protein